MKNNAKKYTEKAAAVAVNKLLAAARKGSRTLLYNTWTDAAGRCCCCDGFRGYRLRTAPAGIKETEWTDRDRAPAGYDLLDKVMKPLEARAAIEIPAPDAETVAAALKDKPGEPFDLGPGAPVVNVKYLSELVKLFPRARWYIDADPVRRYIAPIYIIADEGDALLLPIRSARKDAERAAAQAVQEAPETAADEAPAAAQEAPAAAAQEAPAPAQAVQEAPAAAAQETPAPVYSFTADSITITAPGEAPRTFPASYRITETAAVEVKISGENAPAPVLLFKIGSPYFEAARNATLDAYDAAYNERVQGVKAARAAAQDVPEAVADETPAAPAQDAPEAVAAAPAPADEVPAVQDPETPETPAETEKPAENAPAAETETAAETVEASNIAPAGAFAAFTAAARASYGTLPAAPAASAPAVPEKTFIGSRLVGPGYEIFFDAALQRTRVIFTSEPSAERVAAVTESGFYYSPSQNSYNKKLTFKAYRAALKLTEALDAIPA